MFTRAMGGKRHTRSGGTPPPPRSRPIAPTAIALALGCGFIYLLVAGGFRFHFVQSEFAHHILMADAMLHGQLAVRQEVINELLRRGRQEGLAELARQIQSTGQTVTPAQRDEWMKFYLQYQVLHDWTILDRQCYGYWAPLTPALMVPFVAAFGWHVSDALINCLFGALNVGLFYWFLRRVDRLGWVKLTEGCCIALTLVLALGSVHFYLVCAGRVWFAVQVCTLTAFLCALVAATASRNTPAMWLRVGIFFGAAILGRNLVAVMGLFFIALMWMRKDESGWRGVARRLAAFAAPVAVALLIQGAYNRARFGSVFEDGLRLQIVTGVDPRYKGYYEQYGLFHPHFVPINVRSYFLNWRLPRDAEGHFTYDPEGNSLFLVTPPLLYMFMAWRGRRAMVAAILGGVLPLVFVLMLYFATGFNQWGNRYLLEAMPLLLLLAAMGMNGRITWSAYALVLLSVVANLFGTYKFCAGLFDPVGKYMSVRSAAAIILLALAARFAVKRGLEREYPGAP